MKKIVVCLLVFAVPLFLAACAASANAREAGVAESPAPTSALLAPWDAEIAKAISYGLVPEEIQGGYAEAITFSQYSEMLTRLIRLWDAQRLSEWNEISLAASQSGDEMRREDGILETSYAMVLMGLIEPPQSDFGDLDADAIQMWMDTVANDLSWNYSLFPNWEEVAFPWNHCNYMWGGIQNCASMTSKVSYRAIYPVDTQNSFMSMREPLTRRDAICAILRLAETDPAILEPDGVYVSAYDVGPYDHGIITDALLLAPCKLPETNQAELPAKWRGTGLSACKDGRHLLRDYREADIKFLSESGFNFCRLFLGFSTLRFPDYPQDLMQLNENELLDLDQLIAWGIEYGVHIQISMITTPDGGETFDIGDEEWENIRAYWTALSRRYAGIPSKYLSFDFVNEITPSDEFFDRAVTQVGSIVSAMWQADPQRVILCSYEGNPNAEWVEAMASIGLAVGCHPYYPQYITTSDGLFAEQNPYAKPLWPLPWFPMGEISEGRSPLTLRGHIAGTTLSLHVLNAGENAELHFYADGTLFDSITLSGGTWGEHDQLYYDAILFTVQVPEDVSEVQVWTKNSHAFIDTVLVEGDFGQISIVPHDACDYMDFSTPMPLIINADGTYTNTQERFIDGEEVYRVDIQPYQQIAEKYGVGFMVNEFGIFSVDVHWDVSVVCAYHDSVIQMLEEKGIGWAYCELYNHFGKHLVLLHETSQWANTTVEPVEVSCGGHGDTLYVNRELLEVFKKYTLS